MSLGKSVMIKLGIFKCSHKARTFSFFFIRFIQCEMLCCCCVCVFFCRSGLLVFFIFNLEKQLFSKKVNVSTRYQQMAFFSSSKNAITENIDFILLITDTEFLKQNLIQKLTYNFTIFCNSKLNWGKK